MKTAGRENPTHGVAWPRNRAHGAEEQNRSRSIKWAAKQEKFQPKEMCFFLTSPFIERAKKQSSIRGLNRNCNHDLKNVFKGAAIVASSKPGPFQEFYSALLTKGIRPEMARLTLARKIATIVLMVWKRGACFDAPHLKPQTA